MSATKRERRFPLTLKIFVATALVVVVVLGGTLALVSARATRTADEALRSRLENTSAVAGQVVAAENNPIEFKPEYLKGSFPASINGGTS